MRSTRRVLTSGHCCGVMANMAVSRVRPSSPGAREGCQARKTPSKVAPSAAIAPRATYSVPGEPGATAFLRDGQ